MIKYLKKLNLLRCFFSLLIILSSILSASIFLYFPNRKAYAYNQLGWWLVDSGKHLDWDGSCSYMTQWYEGVKRWNSHRPGVIRVDTFWIIEDVKISDVSITNSATAATTYSNGKIRFNVIIMNTLTDDEKLNVVMHELGHAMGLDHSSSENSIIYTYVTSITSLSQDDKNGYDYLYNNKY
ncbi:MAG: matrixin family metalloprotease [Christensenellaceae bacterium]|jgi:Zn-dependent protease with chaperone function|nr:matrixin family metalloprotease [Christensenellaceae bacterium]